MGIAKILVRGLSTIPCTLLRTGSAGASNADENCKKQMITMVDRNSTQKNTRFKVLAENPSRWHAAEAAKPPGTCGRNNDTLLNIHQAFVGGLNMNHWCHSLSTHSREEGSRGQMSHCLAWISAQSCRRMIPRVAYRELRESAMIDASSSSSIILMSKRSRMIRDRESRS